MAPYLDYRAATSQERGALAPLLDAAWLREDWESRAMAFALREVVPRHVAEVRNRRLPLVDKVEAEMKARLLKEINFWDRRAQDLKAQEAAGSKTRLPSHVAQERANRLSDRLQERLRSLQEERTIMPQPPRVAGAALVVPAGLLRKLRPEVGATFAVEVDQAARTRVEHVAVEAVMAAERRLGREPRDVGSEMLGYDVESRDSKTGDLYFIEVKGRAAGADNIVFTKNEILRALNVPDRWRLAIVLVEGEGGGEPIYVCDFDWGQPGFAQTHSTCSLGARLRHGGPPR